VAIEMLANLAASTISLLGSMADSATTLPAEDVVIVAPFGRCIEKLEKFPWRDLGNEMIATPIVIHAFGSFLEYFEQLFKMPRLVQVTASNHWQPLHPVRGVEGSHSDASSMTLIENAEFQRDAKSTCTVATIDTFLGTMSHPPASAPPHPTRVMLNSHGSQSRQDTSCVALQRLSS